jgi:superfamily II DNA or RNA helicase
MRAECERRTGRARAGDALKLREYQARAISDLRAAYTSGKRAPCLVLPTGGGKCLGIGTPVLKHDGTIRPVESVVIGDRLMGPDGSPRTVLGTTRSTGSLYCVTPARGHAWVCNDVHVLSLVHTETGAIVDIDVQSYLAETKWFRHLHKQFAPERGIDFAPGESLPLDPYFLGVWYGDGTKSLAGVAVSKPDPEILAVCESIAASFGLRVRTDFGSTGCPTHHIVGPHTGGGSNALLDLILRIVGAGTHLPHRYLTASRVDRLEFLAGLLDTDGFLHRSGFEIVQKQRGFSEGVCFLARSLGLRALMVEKIVNGDSYWRVSISGDCSVIPTRIARKRAPERKQIKCATRTGFTIEPIGVGEYAGFELDGDGRFLLGDFTVTHNTVIAAAVVKGAIDLGNRVLFLAHRSELLDQTVRKLASGGIHDVRLIKAACDLGSPVAPVTVASVQTLTRWVGRMPKADLVVFDEAHHVVADTWQSIADSYSTARLLGLTATPQRADGKPLGDVFDSLVVGSTVKELTALGHLVECRTWAPPSKLGTGELGMTPLESYQRFGGGDRAVVFCTTLEHARATEAEFVAAGIPCGVVHGGLAGVLRSDVLKRFETGELRVVLNVYVLTEGWDQPLCSVAIIARRPQHAGTFLQMVGRVLRPAPGKTHAMLLDLCGSVHDHGLPSDDRDFTLDGKGIVKSDRMALRQCPTCGGVYEGTSPTCAICGCEMPRSEVRQPRSIGVGLDEVRPARPPRPMRPITLASKYPGTCRKCRGRFGVGDPIAWMPAEKPMHAACWAVAA